MINEALGEEREISVPNGIEVGTFDNTSSHDKKTVYNVFKNINIFIFIYLVLWI